MKKWTGILIFLALLTLLTYYAMGIATERTLNKNLDSLPDNPVFSVHLDNYQRGWFSSRASLAIKMHTPQHLTTTNGLAKTKPAMDVDLHFPLMVNHGPFIFTDYGVRFGMGQVTTRPATHFSALINYANHTQFRYTLPAMTMKSKSDDQNIAFDWQGLEASLSISPAVDQFDSNFTLYGLDGSSNNTVFHNNAVFQLGEVTNSFNLKRALNGLWLGKSQLTIASMAVSNDNQKAFNLDAFNLLVSSNTTRNALNFSCESSIKKFSVGDQIYGPGIFKLSINNLDLTAMAKINELKTQLLQNKQDPKMAQLALIAELPKLLSKGSELELSELTLTVPEGTIRGYLKISLPESNFNDPTELFQKATGEGQFKAPIAIVKKLIIASLNGKKTPDMSIGDDPAASIIPQAPLVVDTDIKADKIMQNLVNNGLLRIEGNDYSVHITLDNQQLMVNGRSFSPDMLD